jgi:hypothetical protein
MALTPGARRCQRGAVLDFGAESSYHQNIAADRARFEQSVLHKEESMSDERRRWYRGSPVSFVPLWFMGWLFTIGYAGLVWWEILLGIVVWPLYLGRALIS